MTDKEKRKYGRRRCYGKMVFVESDVPGYIRDISSKGMRVECPSPLSPLMSKSRLIAVRILPEDDADFEPFGASVEIRWLRRGELYTTLGLYVRELSNEAEKDYRKLLDLYKAHSSDEG